MKVSQCLISVAVIMASTSAASTGSEVGWIGTWGSSASEPFPKNPNIPIPDAAVVHGTLRYRLPLGEGGQRLELRLSNEAGSKPLLVGDVSVGIADQGTSVKANTIRRVTFSGRSIVAIPAGAPLLSDPVNLTLQQSTDVIVSIYLPEPAVQAQAASGILSVLVDGRDATMEAILEDARPAMVRPIVSAVYVESAASAHTIVAFGDSITDGVRSESQEIRGWPGALAKRLAKAHGHTRYSVANEGISGNRLLRNGMGVSALGRFDRDVLSLPNVSHVIVLEGINDIGLQGLSPFGTPEPTIDTEDLIVAYRQLIARAHQHHIKVYGGTLLPFRGAFYFSDEKERMRTAVNRWIRSAGQFDAVLDFDQAVRDPADPSKIAAEYDSGDNLHPSDAGYAAMARIVGLMLFAGSQ